MLWAIQLASVVDYVPTVAFPALIVSGLAVEARVVAIVALEMSLDVSLEFG